MLEELRSLRDRLRELVARLDAANLSEDELLETTGAFTETERLAAAGRTLCARQVAGKKAWRKTGASSAPAWMARQLGSSIGTAALVLATAAQLDTLPEARQALRAGELSDAQAIELAAAAAAVPGAEQQLVEMAKTETFSRFREQCRTIRAVALAGENTTERIRATRYLRHWLDLDGAVRMDVRLAPVDAAPLIAALNRRASEIESDARRGNGNAELRQAYLADALCALVDGKGAPKAVVNVVVSASALERGEAQPGELAMIEGVGPITVDDIRRMGIEASVNLIERTATDVTKVTSLKRRIPASLRRALENRDPVCVVPGCNRRHGLEIDHIVPVEEGGRTELSNLGRLCRWHHMLKTHHGYKLSGGPGAWDWTPPSDPDP